VLYVFVFIYFGSLFFSFAFHHLSLFVSFGDN